MMEWKEVRPKRRDEQGRLIGIGGWWWHACNNYRVDCPRCGLKEMVYWISQDRVSDAGEVQGEHHCPCCGFGGKLKLVDFKREQGLFPL